MFKGTNEIRHPRPKKYHCMHTFENTFLASWDIGSTLLSVLSGKTIGYKRLMRGAPVVADAVRVTVTDALATPLINNISVFKADERIALEAQAVPGQIQAESCDQLVGAISENKGPNGGGNLGAVTDGSYAKYERVRFDQTPTAFTLSHSGAGTPQITLRLDSQDGPILASGPVDLINCH